MTSNEIRNSFITFFKNKQHKFFESASLIPDDKTLLLTVAGMVPFKPFFLGEKKAPFKRITSYQKCVRVNDLENVGLTPRHHTFFEMLGNFSFGDYFKKESIIWSWEYITEILKLDPNRLWVSVYETDDEAYNIWKDIVKIPENRIVRLGDSDNWWAAGPQGSCGPCSEIYYDTQNFGNNNEWENTKPGDDGNRFLEIWNLVFTEWNRLEDGSLVALPEKNIDTGAGLERIASIVQNKENNFQTDLFMPIILEIKKVLNVTTDTDNMYLKIIADHIRTITFLISDGVLPANEGRGYILKKLIRRAYGSGCLLNSKLLEDKQEFLYKIVPKVVELMDVAYNIASKQEFVQKVLKKEEEKFLKTLSKGINILNEEISKLKEDNKVEIDPIFAFKMYDTYGFPFEFTKLILDSVNIKISEEKFNLELEKQVKRSQGARKVLSDMITDSFITQFSKTHGTTEFVGYSEYKVQSKAIYINLEDNKNELIVAKTPFYANSGGQVSDTGIVYNSEFRAKVVDVIRKSNVYIHILDEIEGDINLNDDITLEIDKEKRENIKRNHTATHLLHKALEEVLEDNSVNQAGSYVDEKRLRFDFTILDQIGNEKLQKIEDRVNEKILESINVNIYNDVDINLAINQGAKALFSDKYGSKVRVVEIKDYSKELCGGTHVKNTSEIGIFKILYEESKSAGVRRIEAITGKEAFNYIKNLEKSVLSLSKSFKVMPNVVNEKIEKLEKNIQLLSLEKENLKNSLSDIISNELEKEKILKDNITYIYKAYNDKSIDELKEIIDKLKNKYSSYVILLGSNNKENAVFVSSVSKNLIDKYKAGEIVKLASSKASGNGGGSPTFAQAGGKDGKKVHMIIENMKDMI